MSAFADRVKETSTTTGTGSITLAGAVTGYQSFNTAFSTSIPFYYTIEGIDGSGVPTGEWEVGLGNLTDSTTLARDFVIASSNGNALVDLSAGTKNVFNTWPALTAQAAYVNMFDLQFGMI